MSHGLRLRRKKNKVAHVYGIAIMGITPQRYKNGNKKSHAVA